MNRTALFVLSKAAKKAGKLLAADRGHLVALDEPFFAGTFRETFRWKGRDLPILPFENDKLAIDGARRLVLKVVERPYCDGATAFPDRVGGVDLAPGYIPHDALYESLGGIASDPAWKAAGWTEAAVRALADIVLGKMVAREERKAGSGTLASRFCSGAARRLGGLWHWIAGAFAVAALCAGLAGCSGGCMAVPDEGFDPSDDMPAYHVVELQGDQP